MVAGIKNTVLFLVGIAIITHQAIGWERGVEPSVALLVTAAALLGFPVVEGLVKWNNGRKEK